MSRPRLVVLMFACLLGVPMASAQSLPTATVGIFPSVFGGGTFTSTGLNSGRNLAITAGLDVGFYSSTRFEYAIEYRGIYPVEKGGVDSQKSNLLGLTLWRRGGRLHPYGDIFFGRGEIDYAGAGAQVPGRPIFYTQSSSNVIAGGGGVNVDLGPHFAVKIDALVQRYGTPVTASGHLYPESATVGLVYRIPHLGLAAEPGMNAGHSK